MIGQVKWRDANHQLNSLRVEDRIFIGRSCKGVPENKRIILDDPAVSRDHAVITFLGERLAIRDTSRNGTRINGVRITSGTEKTLQNDDLIMIGPYTLKVEILPAHPSTFMLEFPTAKTELISTDAIITHLVADMRGFSTVTQELDCHLIYGLMNDTFEMLSQIVHRNKGTVKDYTGDAIFAFWEHGNQEDSAVAYQACRTAIEQHAAFAEYKRGLQDKHPLFRQLEMGWGISTGKVIVSHYGLRNEDMAIVGDSTNLAFRLSNMANKTLNSAIVVCENTQRLIQEKLPTRPFDPVDIKGRLGKERVYGVICDAP